MSNQRYMMRGVSASKEDVHNAIKNIDKGIFPQAFCKIIPDILDVYKRQPPKRRRIKIVSLDHLIHYHPVINTFSSSLYTSILKIPVSLLHISSISGEIYFVIWRSFYYSFSKKSSKFLQERIVGERLHVWIAYNFVIYVPAWGYCLLFSWWVYQSLWEE